MRLISLFLVDLGLWMFFFSSRRRHTICALVTGVQTYALPISPLSCSRRSKAEPQTADVLLPPNSPSTASTPPAKCPKVLPMCPVQNVTYVSGRSAEIQASKKWLRVTPGVTAALSCSQVLLPRMGCEIGRAHV